MIHEMTRSLRGMHISLLPRSEERESLTTPPWHCFYRTFKQRPTYEHLIYHDTKDVRMTSPSTLTYLLGKLTPLNEDCIACVVVAWSSIPRAHFICVRCEFDIDQWRDFYPSVMATHSLTFPRSGPPARAGR